jgi:hypothetical protein
MVLRFKIWELVINNDLQLMYNWFTIDLKALTTINNLLKTD